MSIAQNDYTFSLTAIPTAVTALVVLLFAIRVLMRRVSRVSISYFGLSLFVVIWEGGFTGMFLAATAGTAALWMRVAYFGIPFIAPAIYQFTVEMLRIYQRRRAAVVIGWLLAAQFSMLAVFTDYLVDGSYRYHWGFYPHYNTAGAVSFLTFFFGFLLAAMFEFVHAHPKSQGAERVRIRLLVIAFGLSYISCLDFAADFGIDIYPFGYLAVLGCLIIIEQTVRRYDLIPITPSLAANEIINTMGDALFVCDRDTRIRFANSSALTILGYGEGDLTGRLFDELIIRSEGEAIDTVRRRSIRNAEYVFRTKSGSEIELTLSISPVIHQGEAAGAVIIGRDLRDHKRAEHETRQALTLLESTLDSTADGILVVGPTGRVLTYNKRFVDMWRIPETLLKSGDDGQLVAFVQEQLADPKDFVRTIATLYRQPEAESFDLLEFKDGRRFERYSIGRQFDGIAVRVWSFRDVTARFAAENALRESEVRYRLLFEQNAAGVYVMDYRGRISDCNSTFANLLGYSRRDLVGRHAGELYARTVERDELASMLKDAPTMTLKAEIEFRRKDGIPVWMLQNLSLAGSGEEAFIHATVVDISDRKRAEEQIEYHAYHDVLTRLPNRRLFTDRLALSITRSKRSGRSLAVLFIDLDHFKTVNDTLGHTAGDELLLEMSQRLRNCIREDDTVARLGGDEFTIILSDLRHPEDAVQVAQKILETVEAPLTIGGMTIELSTSIGIALYPVDGYDVETLLRNADSAMYRAKESGRNNYQLCTEEMKTRALERLSLESRLRKAIQNDQLLLMYQPQVNLATGRIVGAEALVRWNDPERGIIEPMTFIPIAEESRLIIPLGEWVLHAACREARQWRDRGLSNLRMAVNLSARQFQQHDLVDMVRRSIVEAGIEPSALELEITETTAMANAEMTIEVLRGLCDVGVSMSIDDFGSGYSSLAYLRRFPINAVKIDRSFIGGLSRNEGDEAIVAAVIAIARSLRLRVIAEGVETHEQFAFLQRKQCDEAQGFYFSPAMTSESISRTLFERPILGAHEPRMFQPPSSTY